MCAVNSNTHSTQSILSWKDNHIPLIRFFKKLFLQKLNCICLDEDIAEVLDIVARAVSIAVDTLMLASSVQVHVVAQAKPGGPVP